MLLWADHLSSFLLCHAQEGGAENGREQEEYNFKGLAGVFRVASARYTEESSKHVESSSAVIITTRFSKELCAPNMLNAFENLVHNI